VEQSLWDGRAVISGAFFNNTIKNLIQGAGATAVNASGKNKIHGLEFELMVWASKNLQLKAQYSYTQAQDANGVQLIRRPKHVASLGSTYTCFDGRLNLGFQANYHGKQDDTAWQAVSPWGSETVQLDGYVLANMTAKYSVTESVSLFARVENIFDEKYEDVYGYANPGLGVYLGVQVSLGK
ncbi:MAG: TonB-dependent receptor, partial [Opitutae bacterium]